MWFVPETHVTEFFATSKIKLVSFINVFFYVENINMCTFHIKHFFILDSVINDWKEHAFEHL